MAELLEGELLENQGSFWSRHREKIAWFILLFDLSITVLFWSAAKDAVLNDAKTRFDFRVEGVRAAIKERMMTYEQVLRSGIGLFEASAQVDRDEWKKFVDTLQIEKRFPGIQGIGFALKIEPEDKEEHIRQIQAEGFLDYKIKPEGNREVYTAIIYLEPFDIRNRQAFGYDMFSQIVRREAMEKARDSGDTTISGKVTLVQEIDEDVQSGFLVYLPLYKKGMSVDTLEQRRMTLKGYVYSPFRAKDLMRGILGPGSNDIDLEVYDGSNLNENTLMYDADGDLHVEGNEQDSHAFVTTKTLNLYGHHWTLRFVSLPLFHVSIQNHKSNFVLVLGGIFSLLCFLVIHGAYTTRRRAIQLAHDMSQELKQNVAKLKAHQDHLEEVVDARTVEMQKANLALEKSKTSLSNLISNLTGMVYHCRNDKDWTMDFVSSGVIELTGYKPEDIKGVDTIAGSNTITYNKIVHPEDRARIWDEIQQGLEIKKPFMLNYKITTSNGKLKHVREKGRGIWLENGELEGLQGFIMDVTDEVTTQAALIKTREQVAHADKLSTLGKLVGSVAHEFNNPLYGVIGLIDNLGEDSVPEERKKYIELAKKECWRMAGMIKNLQNFYKPSEGLPTSIDMNKLIEEVLLIIGKNIKKKGIKVTKKYKENIDTIEAVEDQIKQVIINLLQNASDAILGTLKEIILITEQNEGYIVLKVQDTGLGIPEENMKTLFDPFFTTKGVKGTGLGLSVSYGIVKKHGGEITVESKAGEGSTFTVSLPLK